MSIIDSLRSGYNDIKSVFSGSYSNPVISSTPVFAKTSIVSEPEPRIGSVLWTQGKEAINTVGSAAISAFTSRLIEKIAPQERPVQILQIGNTPASQPAIQSPQSEAPPSQVNNTYLYLGVGILLLLFAMKKI